MTNGPQNIQQQGRQSQDREEGERISGESSQGSGQKMAGETEEWRPVKGYEGFYEVSNLGRIKSLPRSCRSGKLGGIRAVEGVIMKPSPTGKTAAKGAGYMAVHISLNRGSKMLKVHRAVAEAFIPNPQGLPQVNHEDTNTFNNNATNLTWIDNTGNVQHAAANGLLRPQKGEACVTHKLTAPQVIEIRREHKAKLGTSKTLAAKFGISPSQVKRILRKDAWTHI